MGFFEKLGELLPRRDVASPVVNTATGLGLEADSASGRTAVSFSPVYMRSSLGSLYANSGIARTVIEALPHDALKKGVSATSELQTELERLDVLNAVRMACIYERIHGGALVLVFADDGADNLATPLELSRLKSIKKLVAIPACDITNTTYTGMDGTPTPTYSAYVQPETYTISGNTRVHVSRTIRFNGLPLLPSQRRDNNGWGGSALAACEASLTAYIEGALQVSSLLKDYRLTTVKMNGYASQIVAGNESTISRRIALMKRSMGLLNAVVVDSESEDVQQTVMNVSGYDSLMLELAQAVSADTGLPMTRLFGRSPQGMNATGKGDEGNWDDTVTAYQRLNIDPAMNAIIQLIVAQQDVALGEEALEWEWPSVKELSDLESAELRKRDAETAAIWAGLGAVDAQYMFDKHYSGGYSHHVGYSKEDLLTHEGLDIGEDEDEDA